MKPYWQAEGVTLYHGDCLEVLPTLEAESVDAVVTDPPYPDHHTELYQYSPELLPALIRFPCRQLIFWSAKADFPLDYTAIHIWDKRKGVGSCYERIFERNGYRHYRLFQAHSIVCEYNARRSGEEWTGCRSQKPQFLMMRLITDFTSENDMVLDAFMGSGSTGVACVKTGRRFIGIEIDEGYCEIAKQRIKEALMQPRLL